MTPDNVINELLGYARHYDTCEAYTDQNAENPRAECTCGYRALRIRFDPEHMAKLQRGYDEEKGLVDPVTEYGAGGATEP